ncbi:hypothetical protein [Pediococcus argentinicus]|uniref:Uncharacterized protein n=1 Tax=Pediococcus argentinicus TaxID=480391 RepID=A0A0R2NA55_9LACO|nr:hypothetical protein [Pediococcus argentinicus]KRO21323.1 hypothetical protein IV88_GL001447 [Pediococcus argentinicus]NKZ22471.1 hypothetical protein [Pediococcus argentinicus]GEP20296.1 hypothetical protein LSA03_16800 [Pediococcus argentinicus]
MHEINQKIFDSQNGVILPGSKFNYENYMTRAKIEAGQKTYPDNDLRPKLLIEAIISIERDLYRGGKKNGVVKFGVDRIVFYNGKSEEVINCTYDDIEWVQVGGVVTEELNGYPYGYLWLLLTIKTNQGEFHILNSDFKALNSLLPIFKEHLIEVEDPLTLVKLWQSHTGEDKVFLEDTTKEFETLAKGTHYPQILKGENPIWGDD